MGTVLMVAAEAGEFRGLWRHCRGVRKAPLPVRFARTAELNGTRVIAVAHGPGKLAQEAVDAVLQRERPAAIVSVGFCGALDPSFAVGEVFVASKVSGTGGWFEARRPATARGFRSGLLYSGERVVATAEEKAKLRATGADAVEMEAAGVAARAAEAGLPFYCIRAVMDRADEGFSLDFNNMRDRAGRFSRARILRAALARPGCGARELVRIQRQGRRAARALGEFLADCRF